MSEMITVRVRKEIKEKVKKYKIKASEVMRNALLEEVRRIEKDELIAALKDAKEILSKMDADAIIKSIREDRDTC